MQAVALFLFPETNARYSVQGRVASELEKPYGINKNLQQIQNIKRDSAWHKRNGFKTTLGKKFVVDHL